MMVDVPKLIAYISSNKLTYLIFSLILVYVVYLIISKTARKALLIRSKSPKEKNNVKLFISLVKYCFYVIAFLVVIFVLTGSLAGLGVSAGLLTAALGWSLQRPITGIAAWIMILVRKPFQIGDRILIGNTRGDVVDISLTHVYLSEVGGTTAAEESSGRVILIPNSILFEQKIINYTLQDEFILDEIDTLVTYESDLEKIKKICNQVALKFLDADLKEKGIKPYVRFGQKPNGVNIKLFYKVKASNKVSVRSNINGEIIKSIVKTKGVKIAYPHIQVIKNQK